MCQAHESEANFIALSAPPFTIKAVNKAWCILYSIEADQAIGRSLRVIMGPGTSSAMLSELKTKVGTGIKFVTPLTTVSPTLSPSIVCASWSSVHLGNFVFVALRAMSWCKSARHQVSECFCRRMFSSSWSSCYLICSVPLMTCAEPSIAVQHKGKGPANKRTCGSHPVRCRGARHLSGCDLCLQRGTPPISIPDHANRAHYAHQRVHAAGLVSQGGPYLGALH